LLHNIALRDYLLPGKDVSGANLKKTLKLHYCYIPVVGPIIFWRFAPESTVSDIHLVLVSANEQTQNDIS
jgi:hypothetical protein